MWENHQVNLSLDSFVKKGVKWESPNFALCEEKWLKLLNKMFNRL